MPNKPIDIQKIFNKIIGNGFYKEEYIPNKQSQFMCYCLEYAYKAMCISLREYDLAMTEIKDYVTQEENDVYNLEDHLTRTYNKPATFEMCLSVYKDWINRP